MKTLLLSAALFLTVSLYSCKQPKPYDKAWHEYQYQEMQKMDSIILEK